MDLSEAIKKLERVIEGDSRCVHPDYYDAIKLGIEALKRTHSRREHLSWKLEPLLPGETPSNFKPAKSLRGNTSKTDQRQTV